MSPRLFHRLLAVCGATLVAANAPAQLAALSPFMPPPGARDAAATTANAPLEFRGVADLPGGSAFRVVDPARRAGAWLRLNEVDPDLGFVVKQHDAEHDTVVVEYQGRTLTLPLHQSKVVSAGAAMPNAGLNAGPPPPPMPATAVAPPALAVQQAQLEAVAAAVAQRRALREQAQQQVSQGGAVAPPATQPPPPPRAQNAAQQNQHGQPRARNRNGQPQ
jgi:hypothetical protein